MKAKTLSIVMPVFNEEKYVHKALVKICQSDLVGFKKELVIIDDGSTDKTRLKIKASIAKLTTIYGAISFMTVFKDKNEGKGSAVKDGFLRSTGDIVLIQDADLEYNPVDFPILLEPFLKNDADVVYGSRFISTRPHRVLYFWHYRVNLFLTQLSNMLTNLNLTDMETGYKAFKKDIISQIAPKLVSKRFGLEPEITARISKIKGLKIYEVGISYSGRTYEEGKKIGWKDGMKALWEVVRFTLFTD